MVVKVDDMTLFLKDRVRTGRSFQIDNEGYVTRHGERIEHEDEVRNHYYGRKQTEPKGYPKRGSADNPFKHQSQKDISLTGEIEKTTSSLVESTGDQFEKQGEQRDVDVREQLTGEVFNDRVGGPKRKKIYVGDKEPILTGSKVSHPNLNGGGRVIQHIGDGTYVKVEDASGKIHRLPAYELIRKQVQHVNVDSTEVDTDEAARLERARKKRAAQAGEEYKFLQSGIDLRKIKEMERMLEKGTHPTRYYDYGSHIIEIGPEDKYLPAHKKRTVVSQAMREAGYEPTGDDIIEGSKEHKEILAQARPFKPGRVHQSFRGKLSGLTLEKIQTMEEILKVAAPKKSYFAYIDGESYGGGSSDSIAELVHATGKHAEMGRHIEVFDEKNKRVYSSRRARKSSQSDFEKARIPGEPKRKSVKAYKEWMRRGTGKEDWEGLMREEKKLERRRKASEMMGLGTRQEPTYKGVLTIGERIEKGAHGEQNLREQSTGEAFNDQVGGPKWKRGAGELRSPLSEAEKAPLGSAGWKDTEK